jgi:phage shock protein A
MIKRRITMASILAKIRIVTLGNLHELLDAVINLDSPAAVKQYIRDLESGIRQVEHAANVVEGGLRTTRDDLEGVSHTMATLDADINALLQDGDPTNDHLALPLQVEYDSAQRRVETLVSRESAQEQMLSQLNDAISKLNAKHRDMLNQLADIEAKVEAGEGMEAATDAVESVAGLAVDAPSVDDLASRVNQEYNRRGAAFDRAMGTLGDATNDDLAISQAEAALARRKAELQSPGS